MTLNSPFSQKTLNILKASLPFIPPGMQRMVSNLVKIEEFNIMFRNLNDSLDATMSACEYNSTGDNGCNPFNSTDFISAIKPYLNDSERELIDMFMNMMNALNIYNIYKSLPSAAPVSQNFDSFNYGNHDVENQNFNNHSVENQNFDNPDHNFEPSDENVQNADYQNFNNSDYVDSDMNESDESHDKNINNTANQNNFNIETLKSLLSPSQRAMFETYSTLLNNNNSNTN